MANVIIIGGGIIGLCSAFYLHKAGHKVTILEKGDLTNNCSFGNAGMIVPSHFIPLAAPGMIEQGIRWMFDSKSPFYVRPSFSADLLSWGLKFIKNANIRHVERSAVPLRDISLLSKKLYEEIEENKAFEFDLVKKGILMLYKSEKAATEEVHLANKAMELGLDMAVLTPEQCLQLQPRLKLDILGAVHYRCDAHLCPDQLIINLIKYLEEAGVNILRNHEVSKIETAASKVTGVIANDIKRTADHYIISGGSWSPSIARLAGLNIPLLPGKGYSFMVEEEENRMQIPALLAEARVSITPMNGSIRYGGTMEIDKINNRINMNRVRGIAESIPKYFPDLHPEVPAIKDIWFGFRPCSPDGLPYIGRSTKYTNTIIATGHGMMGISLAPATGNLVTQIVGEVKTDIEITPFSPNRYS